MSKSIKMLLLTGGLLSTSLALAHGHGTGRFMQFFDTNKDGVVTLDEFEAAMQTRFNNMDSDHNGLVSAEEFRHYLQQRRLQHKQARLKKMDSNGDGKVSKDEYLAYMSNRAQARFEHLDKNHDGMLVADELDRGCKSRHGHGHRYGTGLFHKLDSNGDGSISLAESRAAWSAWFKRMDTNGDKVVSADEIKAFHDHRFRHKAR